ncbi:MAG: hypothetical protein KIT69_13815 [Propionibacteriaceae bacterium]|nr:hypothetical protein [Propionibacteriaceae bacterium]
MLAKRRPINNASSKIKKIDKFSKKAITLREIANESFFDLTGLCTVFELVKDYIIEYVKTDCDSIFTMLCVWKAFGLYIHRGNHYDVIRSTFINQCYENNMISALFNYNKNSIKFEKKKKLDPLEADVKTLDRNFHSMQNPSDDDVVLFIEQKTQLNILIDSAKKMSLNDFHSSLIGRMPNLQMYIFFIYEIRQFFNIKLCSAIGMPTVRSDYDYKFVNTGNKYHNNKLQMFDHFKKCKYLLKKLDEKKANSDDNFKITANFIIAFYRTFIRDYQFMSFRNKNWRLQKNKVIILFYEFLIDNTDKQLMEVFYNEINNDLYGSFVFESIINYYNLPTYESNNDIFFLNSLSTKKNKLNFNDTMSAIINTYITRIDKLKLHQLIQLFKYCPEQFFINPTVKYMYLFIYKLLNFDLNLLDEILIKKYFNILDYHHNNVLKFIECTTIYNYNFFNMIQGNNYILYAPGILFDQIIDSYKTLINKIKQKRSKYERKKINENNNEKNVDTFIITEL